MKQERKTLKICYNSMIYNKINVICIGNALKFRKETFNKDLSSLKKYICISTSNLYKKISSKFSDIFRSKIGIEFDLKEFILIKFIHKLIVIQNIRERNLDYFQENVLNGFQIQIKSQKFLVSVLKSLLDFGKIKKKYFTLLFVSICYKYFILYINKGVFYFW